MAKGFLHKKRKLRTQVTILITVTIACALVISSVTDFTGKPLYNQRYIN